MPAGAANTRLIQSKSATSDAKGLATFTLGPAEQGFVYEGTVQVPNCPSGALFVATVLNTNWGQWAGPTNYGPIQLYGGESLTVTASGLTPLTNYTMTFFGVFMPEEAAVPVPPAAPESVVTVENATKLIDGTVLTAAQFAGPGIIIRVPPLTRRLSVLVYNVDGVGTVQSLFVKGTTSNIIYFRQLNVFTDLGSTTAIGKVYYVAIEPSVDPEYSIFVSGPAYSGHLQLWVLASSTNPLVETNDYSPLEVVPGHDPVTGNTITFNVSGSPVGTFDRGFEVGITGGSTNVTAIAAPGAGQSIYLQTIGAQQSSGTTPTFAQFNTVTMGNFSVIFIRTNNYSEQHSYPGGLMLPSNEALRINAGAGSFDVFGTYTIGPTL